ncbi:uncharacterized protein LOC110987606 isoform X2 [Acanthaster planci]|uniref:Uncharacterized protein LOC110987606 isoform X2 n=1 Tax=Acanthaster planci TaxID=133434 RepID=A0A8B7ZM67_ACAPL|nr:uncharacterized protein LOC110987606 isoform X2 [Acanthaster planci]
MMPRLSQIECEKFFRQLQVVSCWQPLATACRFSCDQISRIKWNDNDVGEQKFMMLCQLRQREPENWATILTEGLEDPTVSRMDAADDVRQFLQRASDGASSSQMWEKKETASTPHQLKGTRKRPDTQQMKIDTDKNAKRRIQEKDVSRINGAQGSDDELSTKENISPSDGESDGSESGEDVCDLAGDAIPPTTPGKKAPLKPNDEQGAGCSSLPPPKVNKKAKGKRPGDANRDDPPKQPCGDRIKIADLSLKLAKRKNNNWYIIAWKDGEDVRTPQKGKTGYYFHCDLRDESGEVVRLAVFIKHKKDCLPVYRMISKSNKKKPVCLRLLRVEDQGETWKKENKKDCRLVFDHNSEIF